MKDLGYFGVTARIKRLNDLFSGTIRDLYPVHGVNLEPSWHLVLIWLKEKGVSSISDIATAFHISKPAVAELVKPIILKGYLKIGVDKSDNSVRLLTLTEKAESEFATFQEIWESGKQTMREILRSNEALLDTLEEVENEMLEKDFANRALSGPMQQNHR